jgi:dUTP pyrophosphatase
MPPKAPPRPSARPPSLPPREGTPDFEPPQPKFDETMDADPMPDDTTSRIAPRLGTETGIATPGPRPSPFIRGVGHQTHPETSLQASTVSPPNVDNVVVHVRRVGQVKVPLPQYQTPLAAGMDLVAAIDGPLTIAPLARVLVPTGIAMALPPGFEGQVRPRSGLAWSRGLTILNAPGTIDADYRGEIKVLMVNLGSDAADVMPGERIAQLVISRHAHAELRIVEALDDTVRGSGGYGSTGY